MLLVPTLVPRLYGNLTPTSGRLAPRAAGGATNIGHIVFFTLIGIVVVIIIGVSIRKRTQMARRHPMGIVPPGHTFWSRPDGQSHNPYRPDYLERHRSSFDPALPHDYRQGQLPAHPDYAHIRHSRTAGFPFEPVSFSGYTIDVSGRPSSPTPSYDDPEPFDPVAVQPLNQDKVIGKSEKDPLSENNNDCPICFEEYTPERPAVIGAPCRHVLCRRCWKLIVDASKEAAGARRFGRAGDAEVARCHACRMPYVTKTKPAEDDRK